ncbi:lipoprotein, type 6 [Nitzschia inconspicua]|uniref:Lipoprotein, type 6 n=1 Tax=Nitzschia inconspicua TaxID=303405 RepID=A0A9K3L0D9_9STRA|nr:lipoprotein, type 6 [Nitzschia inconspicua]
MRRGCPVAVLLCLAVGVVTIHHVHAQATFANVTLRANGGDLEAVVYLPQGLKPGEPTYYQSTRFDWSSMIGHITRTSTDWQGNKETHTLYGIRNWRVPHDPYWPESGMGLASEFGVGDDGSFCNFFCGWNHVNEVTNGVLGYRDAKIGESFLKIGVGELIKGSCSSCDSAEDYKFNSPYQFATPPVWTLDDPGDGRSITLNHEAVLREHGYQLKKEITLHDDQLLVKTTLRNIGRVPFATAWYSHHFFTCDSHPVGSGYEVDVDLAATDGEYEEPGTWSWATPLQDYAEIDATKDTVSIRMQRGVESNVRIKAEFVKDDHSRGGFTLKACHTSIHETIPEVSKSSSGISMYAYNLYVESGTFSPEPQIYIHLMPGQSTSWTQQLDFQDYLPPSLSSRFYSLQQNINPMMHSFHPPPIPMAVISILAGAVLGAFVMLRMTNRRRGSYNLIPDCDPLVNPHADIQDNNVCGFPRDLLCKG